MRRISLVIAIIVLALVIVFYHSRTTVNDVKQPKSSKNTKTSSLANLTGMPWQIDILPDGHTRVFGLIPGKTTLRQAVAVLGPNYDMGIVESKTGTNLEMYYSDYHAGPLEAKLILAAKTDPDEIQHWKQRAIKKDYLGTGKTKKYVLAAADQDAAMNSVLRAIAFIPAVNIDDDIVRKRFGDPAEKIGAAGGVTYYLYPKKGLSIALSDKAKEVLQYVAPPDFESLRAPLHSH